MKLSFSKLLVWIGHVAAAVAWLTILAFMWTAVTSISVMFWLALAAVVYLKMRKAASAYA